MADAAATDATAADGQTQKQRMDMMYSELGARIDASEARQDTLRQEVQARHDAERDELRETVRTLRAENDQRAPAGVAAGPAVARSVHALAKRDRDDRKTGESHFNANAFDDKDRFDNIKSLEEHKALILSKYPTSPWLVFFFSCGSYTEYLLGGPLPRLRVAIEELNTNMLRLIRTDPAPTENFVDVYIDLFTGQHFPCAETFASIKADGQKGATYQQHFSMLTTKHPINESRNWTGDSDNTRVDEANCIVTQAEWSRIDNLFACVLKSYAIDKPKGHGESLACESALQDIFDGFSMRPRNHFFRMWNKLILTFAVNPGIELRRLVKFHKELIFDPDVKLSSFIAAILKVLKLHEEVNCDANPGARDLLLNKISSVENHNHIHSAASVMLEVDCGLARSLLKSYREKFLLEWMNKFVDPGE